MLMPLLFKHILKTKGEAVHKVIHFPQHQRLSNRTDNKAIQIRKRHVQSHFLSIQHIDNVSTGCLYMFTQDLEEFPITLIQI